MPRSQSAPPQGSNAEPTGNPQPGSAPSNSSGEVRGESRSSRDPRVLRRARWRVRRELARALFDVALLPLRLFAFTLEAPALRRELRGYMGSTPAFPPEPGGHGLLAWPTGRPLRVFLSWAEASGELHALELKERMVRRAREAGAPPPRFTALGSRARESSDLRIVGAPADRAAMGLQAVLGAVPYYLGLLRDAAAELEAGEHDVCVMVDSPALHVPLGRLARSAGVPVVHYVAPQYWGWAPWRVGAYRKAVDRALSILPFEPPWFERRGVPAVHVGHPILDALEGVPSGDERALLREGTVAPPPTLALLPGSRRSVLDRNLPVMLRVAAQLRRTEPELEVILPHGLEEVRGWAAPHLEAAGAVDWVRIETGDLHGSLARCRAALSVSGTVLLDLLHARLPTVVLYATANRFEGFLGKHLLLTPWFASVNLLAGRKLLPEFGFAGEGPSEAILEALRGCYNDGPDRDRILAGLAETARRLGPPGAAERTVGHVLEVAASGGRP